NDLEGIAADASLTAPPHLKVELPRTPPPPAEAPPEDAAIRAPIRHEDYVTVTAAKDLDAWIAKAHAKGVVCVDTEPTSLDPMQAGLCGVSLAVAPGEACYIPCGHRRGEGLALDGGGDILQMREG